MFVELLDKNMEKILNNDFQNNLIEFLKKKGVKEEDAIKSVKEKYHKALKEVAINRIYQFLIYIENDEYDKAENMICRDNDCSFLSFCDVNDNIKDILDIIQELKK